MSDFMRKSKLIIILSGHFYPLVKASILLDIVPEFLTMILMYWQCKHNALQVCIGRLWSLNSFLANGTLWFKY